MVREVRFATDVESGQVRFQVVVDPEATHCVVHSGVDTHGHDVGIFTRDALVHVEQVSVTRGYCRLAQTVDRVCKVQVHAASLTVDFRPNPKARVAHVLRLTRGDVTGNQVAERRVDALQVVIAILFGDVARIL